MGLSKYRCSIYALSMFSLSKLCTQNPKCKPWAYIWGSLYLEGHLGLLLFQHGKAKVPKTRISEYRAGVEENSDVCLSYLEKNKERKKWSYVASHQTVLWYKWTSVKTTLSNSKGRCILNTGTSNHKAYLPYVFCRDVLRHFPLQGGGLC